MSGARSQGGKLTAKAVEQSTSYSIQGNQWTFNASNTIATYRLPIVGASPYTVQPLNFALDGTVTSPVSHDVMLYDVTVYDSNNNTVWSSALYNRLGDTLTASTLSAVDVSSSDVAYYVSYRIYGNSGQVFGFGSLVSFTATVNIDYGGMPETTAPPPFELPDDWVQNTTNTIADKFVPFETVTTPIDTDNADDSVDEFKEFLEGVQEHETLATVFMGYVSELLRLKGLTAFLCFAICCCTMIAIFELSGG